MCQIYFQLEEPNITENDEADYDFNNSETNDMASIDFVKTDEESPIVKRIQPKVRRRVSILQRISESNLPISIEMYSIIYIADSE